MQRRGLTSSSGFDARDDPAFAKQVATALVNKGVALQQLGHSELAMFRDIDFDLAKVRLTTQLYAPM